MDFRKYHGLGNDYLVIDPAELDFEPSPEAVRAICDRNRGVGSDGILLGPIPDKSSGETHLRIFNPDGSEAEKSGNGARIFARFLAERGYAKVPAFSFLTAGGRVEARLLDGEGRMIRLDMGEPSFSAKKLALATEHSEIVNHEASFNGQKCRITCVSMGNPHCVVTGLGADEALATSLGPIVETAPLFPRKTNVQFLEVLDSSTIRIAIWERGAGATAASGSSSCAAAAAARRLGFVGDRVKVLMPGGDLDIEFKDGHVHMTGPVEKCFEGMLSEELMARAGLASADRRDPPPRDMKGDRTC